MIKFINKSKERHIFEQKFDHCSIYISGFLSSFWTGITIKNEKGKTLNCYLGNDHYETILKSMVFYGHYVKIITDYSDCDVLHESRTHKLYFRDKPAVDFLRDNIVEMFRLGGDDYDITVSDDGFAFYFEEKKSIGLYASVDSVEGNQIRYPYLDSHIQNTEAFLRVRYSGDLKDVLPLYEKDGYNYYEIQCDAEQFDSYLTGERWGAVNSIFSAQPNNDLGPGERYLFILKLRKNHPDNLQQGGFSVNYYSDYTRINYYDKDNESYVYFPETGISIPLCRYFYDLQKRLCVETITTLYSRLNGSEKTYVSEVHDGSEYRHKYFQCLVEMTRKPSGYGSDLFVLKVYGKERVITAEDVADDFEDASAWLQYYISAGLLADKWNKQLVKRA